MKEIFGEYKSLLLKQFIITDASDYPFYKDDGKLNKGGEDFVEHITGQIKKFIVKNKHSFDRFIIRSYGNTGVVTKELTISPIGKFFNIEKNIACNLCNCGRKSHWGTVEIIKKGNHD